MTKENSLPWFMTISREGVKYTITGVIDFESNADGSVYFEFGGEPSSETRLLLDYAEAALTYPDRDVQDCWSVRPGFDFVSFRRSEG